MSDHAWYRNGNGLRSTCTLTAPLSVQRGSPVVHWMRRGIIINYDNMFFFLLLFPPRHPSTLFLPCPTLVVNEDSVSKIYVQEMSSYRFSFEARLQVSRSFALELVAKSKVCNWVTLRRFRAIGLDQAAYNVAGCGKCGNFPFRKSNLPHECSENGWAVSNGGSELIRLMAVAMIMMFDDDGCDG